MSFVRVCECMCTCICGCICTCLFGVGLKCASKVLVAEAIHGKIGRLLCRQVRFSALGESHACALFPAVVAVVKYQGVCDIISLEMDDKVSFQLRRKDGCQTAGVLQVVHCSVWDKVNHSYQLRVVRWGFRGTTILLFAKWEINYMHARCGPILPAVCGIGSIRDMLYRSYDVRIPAHPSETLALAMVGSA